MVDGFADGAIDDDGFGRLLEEVTVSMTREAERSLWLNRVVAVRIAEDPQRALVIANENLERMGAWQVAANPWLARWRSLIDAGVDTILGVLTSRDPEAAELRQNSPFAGVLDYREREQVLENFRQHWMQAHNDTSVTTS